MQFVLASWFNGLLFRAIVNIISELTITIIASFKIKELQICKNYYRIIFVVVVDLSEDSHVNDTQGKTVFHSNSVQEFIEMDACLLVTFFICLHNQ